jgi:hypothetical protein
MSTKRMHLWSIKDSEKQKVIQEAGVNCAAGIKYDISVAV